MKIHTLRLLFVVALIFSLLAPSANAHAATFPVFNLDDDGLGSLRQAIVAANATAGADTITFSISGTIKLVTMLPLITDAAELTIDGSGQAVTISGEHLVRVMRVESGASLTLDHLTIANGTSPASDAGGGIYNKTGTVTISNSTFSGNNAAIFGGGLCNEGGTVTITNSTFSGNNAIQGGGVFNDSGTLTVTNSIFSLNTGDDGGGIAIYCTSTTNSTTIIANVTFSGNSATNAGGGILVFGYAGNSVTVLNSTLSGNSSANSPWPFGGGIRINSGTVTFRNTIIANNTSGGNCSGVPINGGNNLDSGTTCGWGSASASISNTDPLLEALTGSPAYFLLHGGSPAIDAGNDAVCASAPLNNTSQNGIARPQGFHCDSGSYEQIMYMHHLPLIMH